jgi:hypothetical protein
MITKTLKTRDCSIVDSSVRLEDFRKWKANNNELLPFYLRTGDTEGIMFEGRPEAVRQLMRTYSSQKLFFLMTLVSFFNSEGIEACGVSRPTEEVLGYRAEISHN